MESANEIEIERGWIQKSKADITAFEYFYSKYYDEIFRYFFRRTDNEAIAAELCSNTFYKALSNIKKYEWRGIRFNHWLYRIAANELNKHYKNKQLVLVIDYPKIMEPLELDSESDERTEHLIKLVFDSLQEDELRLIELKHFEQLTFREVCDTLNEKESAVKMRYYRLLDKMKRVIEKEDGKV